MTQSRPEADAPAAAGAATSMPSPYDTGDRCEPKSWIPYGTTVSEATPAENFGKVDFEDDEGHTVCVVHVERDEHGRYAVHVQPLCDDEELVVVVHRQCGTVIVDADIEAAL